MTVLAKGLGVEAKSFFAETINNLAAPARVTPGEETGDEPEHAAQTRGGDRVQGSKNPTPKP